MSHKKKRPVFHLEKRHHPMLTWPQFLGRVLRYFAFASALVGLSLVGGMAGYHYLENLPWIDSFLNASMILSGMGPVHTPVTYEGKLFAGLYALYSGLALVAADDVHVRRCKLTPVDRDQVEFRAEAADGDKLTFTARAVDGHTRNALQ